MTVQAWWFERGKYRGMATVWENGSPCPLPAWFVENMPKGEIVLSYNGQTNDGRTVKTRIIDNEGEYEGMFLS